jgi:hypothetical protein
MPPTPKTIAILFVGMATRRHDSERLGGDARIAPAYSFVEASRYLRMPIATFRRWSLGMGKVLRCSC